MLHGILGPEHVVYSWLGRGALLLFILKYFLNYYGLLNILCYYCTRKEFQELYVIDALLAYRITLLDICIYVCECISKF